MKKTKKLEKNLVKKNVKNRSQTKETRNDIEESKYKNNEKVNTTTQWFRCRLLWHTEVFRNCKIQAMNQKLHEW